MNSNKKKILIIDDEKCIGQTLSFFLEKLRYGVISVESGEEAIKLLKEEPFDVVICDVVMPDISGISTLKHIVSHYPHIPVIMLSGLANDETREDAMKEQAFDFLEKPVRLREIQKVVERAVDSGKAREEKG